MSIPEARVLVIQLALRNGLSEPQSLRQFSSICAISEAVDKPSLTIYADGANWRKGEATQIKAQRQIPPCYYCGMASTGNDHVVPLSLLKEAIRSGNVETYLSLKRGRILLVPCCPQCNHILGNKFDFTLNARKARLKRELRKRLGDGNHLNWTDSQIDKLGPTLNEYLQGEVNKAALVRFRLSW